MGARGAGHITRLTEIGRPDVGIVTSVAMAHVEYFGDLEGVARAKSELVAALPPTGVAVLNFDDPRVAGMASVSPCPVLRYGVGGRRRGAGRATWPRRRPPAPLSHGDALGQARGASSPLHGLQQVPNALAAAAAALWCGVPLDGVVAALGSATGSPLRMEVRRVPTDRSWSSTATTRTRHRPKRRCARWRPCRPAGSWPCSGSWPSWGPRPRPSTGGRRRLADELGIEVVGYQTALYGPAQVVERR